MSGVRIETEARGFAAARSVLDRLSYLDTMDLLDTIGAIVETQVRRRISEEKTDPEGRPWEPLSPAYEARKKRISSGGLLELFGHLLDSIQHTARASDATAEIGTNLIQGPAMQFGLISDAAFSKALSSKYASAIVGGVPARPFLGLSDENQDELEAALNNWLLQVATP